MVRLRTGLLLAVTRTGYNLACAHVLDCGIPVCINDTEEPRTHKEPMAFIYGQEAPWTFQGTLGRPERKNRGGHVLPG